MRSSGFTQGRKIITISKHANKHNMASGDFEVSNSQPLVGRNYLKGSKLEMNFKRLYNKCTALQRRVAPVDSDFADIKNSFPD